MEETGEKIGVVKLNVYGALDHQNGVFGTCAICRNENGDCLGVLLASPGIGFLFTNMYPSWIYKG